MNVRNFLFMNLTGKVLPFANLEDIMLAQTLGEKVRTIIGNPLTFRTKKAQKAKNPSLTLLPVQNLNGYDHAWIGGMGKNKWSLGDITTQQSGIAFSLPAGTYTCSCTPNGNQVVAIRFVYSDDSSEIARMSGSNHYTATVTLTNDVVKVNTGLGTDTTATNVQVESGSTKTDYEPYENICTISGRTMSSVWGSKKNMLPTSLSTIKSLNTTGEWNGNAYTINNVTFTVQMEGDKVVGINANGQASADATLFIYGNTTAYFSSTTITFKGSGRIRIGTPTNGSPTTFLGVVWSTIQNKFIYGTELFNSGYTMNGFGVKIKNGYNAQNILFKPIIFMDDEDYTFEPYEQSCFINFTFGQTVYGGKVDFDTGVMSIDTLRVDLGSLSWSASSAPIVFYADPRTLGEFIGVGKTFIACDSYQCQDNVGGVGAVRNYPDGSICGFTNPDANYHRIYVKDTRFTDANEFSNEVNGVYACYKLATPQTIQLTPAEINLLKGVNNIWTDGDSIELTYKG